MAYTVGDVISRAREVVQDVDTDFQRHSDTKMVGYLNDALSSARRLRPDLFLPDLTNTTTPFLTVGEFADPFPVEDVFFTVFVEYVAGFVGIGDDEFAQDGRAAALLNRFAQKLTAKGA